MIKGVDGQIMTQRAAEYSKDVNTMLRKDDVANDFADRMNKLSAQQEQKSVTQMEKTEHARVRLDQERETKQHYERRKQSKHTDKDAAPSAPEEELLSLRGVNEAPQTSLLDIEI